MGIRARRAPLPTPPDESIPRSAGGLGGERGRSAPEVQSEDVSGGDDDEKCFQAILTHFGK